MTNTIKYRISLIFTVLLTVGAFVLLLGSVGKIINGAGSQPWYTLIPYLPILMIALAGLNCTYRKRKILRADD